MIRLFAAMAVVFSSVYGASAASLPLLVVGTGESHAMIDPCDCELEPGGGVTRRATLIEQLRKKSTLLLCDAGGFSGGGIYDDYTQGRKADSVRTIQMIAAMGGMKYDAVAIGDDDLQYGGAWLAAQAATAKLPLVSANCTTGKGAYLVKPYVIVKHNGTTFGITAVCTQERLFPRDTLVQIGDPVKALKSIWNEICQQSDVQIIIAHIGQEAGDTLATAFPEGDLILNGHRKTGSEPLVKSGTVPMLQFGFQGKSLSAVKLEFEKGVTTLSGAAWHDVLPNLPEDGTTKAILKNATNKPPATQNTFDLYIMSQCPYGLEALRAVSDVAASIPAFNFDIWFIGNVDADSTFRSLHGEAEIDDEMVWLAFRKFYPERWKAFCRLRSNRTGETRILAAELGADIKKIDAWIRTSGKNELRQHYTRSMRQSIDASPTLLVNNRPFGRNITPVNIQRFICSEDRGVSPVCDSLPECSEIADCRKRGYHGTCSEEGTCVYREAVPFAFTVVTADSTEQHPEKLAISTTEELFPGASVVSYQMSSSNGAKLIAAYQPQALPLYLFGGAVAKDQNFARIEEGVARIDTVYTFRQGVVPCNYLLQRKKTAGSLVLYIDPLFKGAAAIIQSIMSDSLYAQDLSVEPMLYTPPQQSSSGEEMLRLEEAHRWLLLGAISPKVKVQYLTAYSKNPGSSWWTQRLTGTTLSADSLANRAVADSVLLGKHWKTVKLFTSREPVVLLKDNVEVITVSGERELRRLLGEIVK